MSNQAPERARELFSSGFYWAESVLLAVAEALDIQSDIFPKIAPGFCSGIARSGGQCGALSGAIMGLGLITGRNKKGVAVDNNCARVRGLMVQFEQ